VPAPAGLDAANPSEKYEGTNGNQYIIGKAGWSLVFRARPKFHARATPLLTGNSATENDRHGKKTGYAL
jgi:hypothetical protein